MEAIWGLLYHRRTNGPLKDAVPEQALSTEKLSIYCQITTSAFSLFMLALHGVAAGSALFAMLLWASLRLSIESPNIAEEMQGKPRERCPLQPSEPPSSAPRSRSLRRQSRRRRSVRRDKRRDDSAFDEPSPSAGLARQNNVGSVTNRDAM